MLPRRFPSLLVAAIVVAAPVSAQLSPRQRAMLDLANLEMKNKLGADAMSLASTGGLSELGRTPMVLEESRLLETWPYGLGHDWWKLAPADKQPPVTRLLIVPVLQDLDGKADLASYVSQLARTLGALAPGSSSLGQVALLDAGELTPFEVKGVALELHRLYGGNLSWWESAVKVARTGVREILDRFDLSLKPYIDRLRTREAELMPDGQAILRQLAANERSAGDSPARLRYLATTVTMLAEFYRVGGAEAGVRAAGVLPPGPAAPPPGPAAPPAGPAAPPTSPAEPPLPTLHRRQRAMVDLATLEIKTKLGAETMSLTGTGGLSELGRTPTVLEERRLLGTWPYRLGRHWWQDRPADTLPPATKLLVVPVIKDLDGKADIASYVRQLARTLGALSPNDSSLGQAAILDAGELQGHESYGAAQELHRLYGGKLSWWETAVREARHGVLELLNHFEISLHPYVERLRQREAELMPEGRTIVAQLPAIIDRWPRAQETFFDSPARLRELVTAVTRLAELHRDRGADDGARVSRAAGPAAPPLRPAAPLPGPAAPPPGPAAPPPAPAAAAVGPAAPTLPPMSDFGQLPVNLQHLVHEYASEPFGAPRSERWPFLDLQSGHRFPPPPGTAAAFPGEGRPRPLPAYDPSHGHARLNAAYGLPYPLIVPPIPEGGGQLVTVHDTYAHPSAGMIQRELLPGMPTIVRFTGHVDSIHVENLERPAPGVAPGVWRSHLYRSPVNVRGVLPLAGDAAEAGHRDGVGPQALCGRPSGMDLWNPGTDRERLVFTEEGGHAVRLCTTAGGEVSTLCGSAGEAGFRDGPAKTARFRKPTFVTVGRVHHLPFAWVSDPGNHAVRQVDLMTGEVSTYYQTPDLDPRGLVWAGHELFVADQGSHAILAITPPEGRVVRVLAGGVAPEGGRAVDGAGPAARFLELQGLAPADVDLPGHYGLYVLDGHALRYLSSDGTVTTKAGQPEAAGFMDTPERGGEPGVRPACFRNPTGLAVAWDTMLIADTGNHAIRAYSKIWGTVTTLAGDPDAGAVRWGLLRDGLAGPFPEADYATLSAPMALTFSGRRNGDLAHQHLFLGTGSTLADLPPGFERSRDSSLPWVQFSDPLPGGSGVSVHDGAPGAGPVPGAFVVESSRWREMGLLLGRPPVPPALPATPFHFHYWVECFAADGTPAGRVVSAAQGLFRTSIPMPPLGLDPGTYTLRIRIVTLDGHTVATTRAVTVAPGP